MDTLTVDDLLLRDNRLFRGGQSLAEQRDSLASGLTELDQALPWGGFPRGALTEILHAQDGIGELYWLLPALRRAMAEEPIALINPPYLPYAPALQQAGLPLSRLIWLSPPGDRVLWAAEQCLRAGCLAGVLLWHGGGDERPLRRLQVVAESGRSLAWLFRPAKHASNPSPAALRIELERDRLQVLKCRGAVAPVQPIALPVPPALKVLSTPSPQRDLLPVLEEQPQPQPGLSRLSSAFEPGARKERGPNNNIIRFPSSSVPV